MKVSVAHGNLFTLECENTADRALLDALDHHRAVEALSFERQPSTTIRGAVENHRANVAPIRRPHSALRTSDASGQVLRALGQIVSLALGEATQHRHVGPSATDPKAQEQFAACLVQLQLVAQALREVVVKLEPMFQKVVSAHDAPGVGGEPAIVREGGAA